MAAHTRPVSYESVQSGWREQAACADADPDLFGTHPGRNPAGRARPVAVQYCLRCPVRTSCAEDADRNSELGLWAGTYRIGYEPSTYRVIDLLAEYWVSAA